MWRRVVIGWALLVAVAGALTLWMQDSAQPRGPYVWQDADPDADPDEPPALPTCPTTGAVACAYADMP